MTAQQLIAETLWSEAALQEIQAAEIELITAKLREHAADLRRVARELGYTPELHPEPHELDTHVN